MAVEQDHITYDDSRSSNMPEVSKRDGNEAILNIWLPRLFILSATTWLVIRGVFRLLDHFDLLVIFSMFCSVSLALIAFSATLSVQRNPPHTDERE